MWGYPLACRLRRGFCHRTGRLLNVMIDLCRQRFSSKTNRIAKRVGLGPTVADCHDAFDSKQQGTTIFGVVHARHHACEHGLDLGWLNADLLHHGNHGAQHIFSAALADLQQHVAGEAIANYHVALAAKQFATFHVAEEVDWHLLQQRTGFLDQRVALQLFTADIEDADARLGHPKGARIISPTHDRVLRQMVRLGLRICTDVDHQERVLLALNDRADCRATNAF